MPAISCTAADLAAASKCLCGIASPADRQRVMIYLLQHIAGLDNLTPTELVARAKCLCGIPENRLKAVEVALLCAATGGVPPCPPCPPGGNCTYQDMQVAWTPTNLKLGENLGFTLFTDPTPPLLTLTLLGANVGVVDIETTTALTAISIPNAVSVVNFGNMYIDGNTGLVSISMPSMVNANSQTNLHIKNNPLLSTINASSLAPFNTGYIDLANNALDVGTVNQILSRAVATAGFVEGTIDLSGGTNAAPLGQGLADLATLLARNPPFITVNVNP